MTWLEVADSAIKIGLGAVIAAISTILITKIQHRHSLHKDRVDREYQLLKGIAEKVEQFTHAALKHWAVGTEWQRSLRANPDAIKPKDMRDSRTELFNRFNDVTASEALLLLLGQEKAQAKLRAYGEYVSEFGRLVSRAHSLMPDDAVAAHRSAMLRLRAAFFDELHLIYKGLDP
jgi:hypothetical protein